MWIVRDIESYPPDARPAVVALGMFDGVHLGHRAILGTAVERARAARAPAVTCTFDPHPMEILEPSRAPLPIVTLDERIALIAESGLDGTVILRFSRALAAIEAETFVKDTLVSRLRAREVVIGFNHTFGRGARGNPALLRDLGGRYGFATHVVPPYAVDGEPVSSTAIRTALRSGEVERASRLLGRPYTIVGHVESGAGRGRQLGFPTANLRTDRPLLVARGVYACRAEVEGAAYEAVVNVGVRPTFGETDLAVEAHLLDFSGDLYGRRLRLHFERRLRDERRFASADDLRAQIVADVERARRPGA
jgi:riboflavin kinase/FMN adenylyltransferase